MWIGAAVIVVHWPKELHELECTEKEQELECTEKEQELECTDKRAKESRLCSQKLKQ